MSEYRKASDRVGDDSGDYQTLARQRMIEKHFSFWSLLQDPLQQLPQVCRIHSERMNLWHPYYNHVTNVRLSSRCVQFKALRAFPCRSLRYTFYKGRRRRSSPVSSNS